ncbi:MAG: FmdB family zinc ribbon protein [Nitrospirota bacterium]
MPIYEYECTKCRTHHEIMQKITEKPLTKCPDCGGKMKKMISNTSFVLKGTGWYVTDYASNRKNDEAKDSRKKTDKPVDLKSELKKETTTENNAKAKEAVAAK